MKREKFRIDFLDMVIGKQIYYTNSENKLARWCKVFTSTTKEEFVSAIGDGLKQNPFFLKFKICP